MDNKVVHTLARSFLSLECVAVRFNFRGVGDSAGSYGDGVGETEDALAVAAWARLQWPELRLYPETNAPLFSRLNTLKAALIDAGIPLDTLSMGMSADLEAAIGHGSTIVRIGTAIFGPRQGA